MVLTRFLLNINQSDYRTNPQWKFQLMHKIADALNFTCNPIKSNKQQNKI